MEKAQAPSSDLTGVPDVDRVIRALDELDDRPIGDHVAIFEEAHEQLRAGLDVSEPVPPSHTRSQQKDGA